MRAEDSGLGIDSVSPTLPAFARPLHSSQLPRISHKSSVQTPTSAFFFPLMKFSARSPW